MSEWYAPLKQLMDWATEDPTGRAFTLGAAVFGALIVLFLILRTLRWAIARWKALFGVAVTIGIGYYACMTLLDAGPVAWAVAGMVAFGAFVGFALALGGGRRR
jgi:hypothetical protein